MEEAAMTRTRLTITGMSCAACQAHVQKALQRQPGVADASVNLMTHEATVDYDPAAVAPEQLVEAVRATGYGADLPAENSAGRGDTHHDEYRGLRRRAV